MKKLKELRVDFLWWLEDVILDVAFWIGDKAAKWQEQIDTEWAQEMFKDSEFKIIKKLN